MYFVADCENEFPLQHSILIRLSTKKLTDKCIYLGFQNNNFLYIGSCNPPGHGSGRRAKYHKKTCETQFSKTIWRLTSPIVQPIACQYCCINGKQLRLASGVPQTLTCNLIRTAPCGYLCDMKPALLLKFCVTLHRSVWLRLFVEAIRFTLI